MKGFIHRKIRKNSQQKVLMETKWHNISVAIGLIFLLFSIYYIGQHIRGQLQRLNVLDFVIGAAKKDLAHDEKNHTNILLLGVGGEGHEGKDLTDTIIVASLDHVEKKVSLFSLPRDFYVESKLGGSRINRLYEQSKLKWGSMEGLDFVRSIIEKIVDVPLHYVVKADFEAFVKIVDSLGGIEINVEETIKDTEYPRDGTYDFQPFFIEKGLQHLDGKTALKYVRSRKTTSDFDRSKRQHQVLVALREKAESQNIFEKTNFIKKLYYSLSDHLETDMSIREIIGLAEFAMQWKSSKLSTAILNDEPGFRGGFLYTPLRELYGGAYVLRPAGEKNDSIKIFSQLVLYGPHEITKFPIVILNATKKTGVASKVKSILTRYGFVIDAIGNAASISNNKITQWYKTDVSTDASAQKLIFYLQKLIPGNVVSKIPPEYKNNPKYAGAKIFLEIGDDALQSIVELDIFKNVVPLVPSGTSSLSQPPPVPTPAPSRPT